MADLTSAAAGSVVAGVGAVTMALLGLHPGVLFCGFVGAGFGVTTTQPAGKWRTMWMFAFAMFAGALFGAWLAAVLFPGSAIADKALALLLATVALRLQALVARRLEPIARGWLDKLKPKQP